MESLVREMQDPENGVPVRSQKLFLTSIPSAFMGQWIRHMWASWSMYSNVIVYANLSLASLRIGYDMIEWLMERLSIDDSGKLTAFIVYILNVSLHNSYSFYFFSRYWNSGSNSHRQSFVSAWLLLSCWRVQKPCCQGWQLPLSIPGNSHT